MGETTGRQQYADIIVDITHEKLDRIYQYRIPDTLAETVRPGVCVEVPFGRSNRLTRAYVLALSDTVDYDPEKIKEIASVSDRGLTIESRLIRLAMWIRKTYGCTMIQALKTVLPVKEKETGRMQKQLQLAADEETVRNALEEAEKKHHKAKVRLLRQLLVTPVLLQADAVKELQIGSSAIAALSRDGIITISETAAVPGDFSLPPGSAGQTSGTNAAGGINASAGTAAAGGSNASGGTAAAGGINASAGTAAAGGSNASGGTAAAGGSNVAGGINAAVENNTAGGTGAVTQEQRRRPAELSAEQSGAVQKILQNWQEAPDQPCLIEGVTGSGKTLVYMALAEQVLREGRQVIVLIPEISLSWQNVRRFRERFGDIVTVIHSRMSKRERYLHYESVRSGQAQIVVGPRSALFTPFSNTGLIILDEEQESSYRSEETPRYDARETAIARAGIENAHVVFGSATPSLDSAQRARAGSWLYIRLKERYGNAQLPSVEIVDMRKELQAGNRSMISRTLQAQIADRLARREQTILFLNKRGMAGFISCRNCGAVMKCPHCDVSLTAHRNGMLICHYCNYRTPYLTACPVCGSPHIYGFRAGTEKIEQTVSRLFPEAQVIRMDADTTGGKEGHNRILKAFAAHEADILIGTQMIVKGHDFPNVTLVGALLADLSLFASDYRAAERTYQLIVQAVGRAGRGNAPGSAVIQTYNPEHYSIETAAEQDYDAFFRQEMGIRELLQYPPAAHLLTIHMSSKDAALLNAGAGYVKQYLQRVQKNRQVSIIGPAPEAVAKMQEYHRAVISIKGTNAEDLLQMRAFLESYIEINSGFDEIRVQYDLDR